MGGVTTSSTARPGTPALVPRGVAAGLGVLAVGAALGSAHLVAGVVSPTSSPFLAVGDTAIALAPQWLVDVATSAFGTADKPVLLAGMVVVLLLAAAAAGIASRARTEPGTRVIIGLGLLGLAAVLFSPAFTPVGLLAPAVAAGTGVVVFRWLHAVALRSVLEPDASRRRLLVGSSGLVASGALAATGLGQLVGGRLTGSVESVTALLRRAPLAERAPAIPAGAAFPEVGTPAFRTSNAEFYRIDTALRIPTQTAAEWSLRLHGMVDRELILTFDDLLARPLLERTLTMVCVSNEVGGDYISTADFVGVDLREILLEAGIAPGADQLLSTSSDRLWTAGTPMDVLLEPDRGALLAIGMNGEALPPEHGFPVRMVVPGLYGYVSATKWVADLEVTTFDREQAYWLRRGWGERGPVKTQSRIDTPRSGGTTRAGRVAVAGIAWSPPRGVSRVEVRVDGGAWFEAEAATEVSGDTWRMWRTTVDLAPGDHVVQVRATDTAGDTQTERRADVVPDGATGYHSVAFTAT